MTKNDTRTEEAAAKILHLGKMLNLAADSAARSHFTVTVQQILDDLVSEYSIEGYDDGYDDGWRRGFRYQKKDRDAE